MPSKENRRYWLTRWQIPLGPPMRDRWIHTSPRAIRGPADVLDILGLAA